MHDVAGVEVGGWKPVATVGVARESARAAQGLGEALACTEDWAPMPGARAAMVADGRKAPDTNQSVLAGPAEESTSVTFSTSASCCTVVTRWSRVFRMPRRKVSISTAVDKGPSTVGGRASHRLTAAAAVDHDEYPRCWAAMMTGARRASVVFTAAESTAGPYCVMTSLRNSASCTRKRRRWDEVQPVQAELAARDSSAAVFACDS